MKKRNGALALSVVTVLTLPSLAFAEGFYAAIQLGIIEQASDSEAYGNNIAVDADFPSGFDAGDGRMKGVAVGYQLNERLRFEGRLSRHGSSFNTREIGTGALAGEEYVLNGEIESTSLTVEGFYDFKNQSAFTPYVKVGLGVSRNDYSARLGGAGVAEFDAFDGVTDGYYDNYADGDSTEFSYNLGFGGSYSLSSRASLFGEYQYSASGDVETGQDDFTDGFKVDGVSHHGLSVGVRVTF